MILAAATITVAGLAFLATAVPAYRASRIDPSRVLRPE
jgi:ABC-type lipoprotein release transport system permease subunit